MVVKAQDHGHTVLEQSPPLLFEGMDDIFIHDKVDRDTNTTVEEEEISVSPSHKRRTIRMA